MKYNITRHFSILVCLWVCLSTARALAVDFAENTRLSIWYDINGNARTRLGSIDGPLAGKEILAYAFAGLTPSSLQPFGNSSQHFVDINGNPLGLFYLDYGIPFIPLRTPGFAQVVAWDASVWGADYSKVPESQIGYSEVTPFEPDFGAPGPGPGIHLTKSIIVPTIPEPGTWALLAMGGLLMTTVYLKKR